MTQSYNNFELIISDNASADLTWDICCEYMALDSRVRAVRQPENKGAMSNFEFVLGEAKCEYFMWAACDDAWDKRFLEKCVACLDHDSNVGIVFPQGTVSSIHISFIKMKATPRLCFSASDDAYSRIRRYILLDESSHKANVIYGLWRVVKARYFIEVWKELAVIREGVRFSMDAVACAVVLEKNSAVQINEVLFYKYYRYIPPGHFLGRLLSIFSFNEASSKRYKGELVANNAKMLKFALKKHGAWDDKYGGILDVYASKNSIINN